MGKLQLLTCPACGREKKSLRASLLSRPDFDRGEYLSLTQVDCLGGGGLAQVVCMCGARGPIEETDEKAVDAWNAMPRHNREFRFGDRVEVSDDGEAWVRGVFIYHNVNEDFPYDVICPGEFGTSSYNYCRHAGW